MVAAAGPFFHCGRSGRPVSGGFVDRSSDVGHTIRDGVASVGEGPEERIAVAIVGGGIAGLSAAWWLRKQGVAEFVVLELEDQAGGNSRSGEAEGTRFPWGAHYLPVPDRRIPLVDELFSELGVLNDGVWDEAHMVRAPVQRLFRDGEWLPVLEGDDSGNLTDSDHFKRFWDRMDYYRQGREFQIPIAQPHETARLDRMSMKTWLIEEGLFSEHLHWYVDYACRDDYGCSYVDTSAWAGIHYFAARPEDDLGPLTWPEGNAWIVDRLMERVGSNVRTGTAVVRIERDRKGAVIRTASGTIRAEAVVYAAPLFVAPYLMPEWPDLAELVGTLEYSPWLSANLVLDESPPEDGLPLAWENILYGGENLGYVSANHQMAGTSTLVWTYYRALARGRNLERRRELLETPWETWKGRIVTELAQAHPDLGERVRHLDIMRFGHAMVRPTVGYLTSEERRRLVEYPGPVFFANADLSGISIFEEAQYRGVRAAERALEAIG